MFEKIKAWPGQVKNSIDGFMENKMKFSDRQRHLTWHYVKGLWDQILAIIPISVFQILVLAIFFQQSINDAGLQVMGLVLAIIGLTMFLDGLRVSVMPMAECMGEILPQKLHLSLVLLIAGFMGILVTYAEPAIASLRPLAALVDPERAPYLYFVMNQQQELMIFAIGAGVGVAAVIGTLRFVMDWPLKPLIYLTLAPTIGTACWMQWGNPNLAPIIGMAWDCGGVTTGPVTVPVLLALGIGVMRSSRKRRLARAALEASVAAGSGQALEGFGIVTLASLFPVLAVQLMGIIDGAIYDYDYVLNSAKEAAARPPATSAIDTPPVSGVVYAIRSIMPLVIALIFIIVVILRKPLPECSFWVDPPFEDDASIKSGASFKSGSNAGGGAGLNRASVAIAKGLARSDSQSTIGEDTSTENTEHGNQGAALAALQATDSGDVEAQGGAAVTNGQKDSSTAVLTAAAAALQTEADKQGTFMHRVGRWFVRNAPLLGGICITQLGMIAFNEGLTYAFTALGDQTGTTLPAAFLEVPYLPKSPYYSYAGGLILVLVVVFLLGVLATRAEPALNVLGRTVERLSGGAFTCKMLINSVCLGVGIGIAAGAAKILYSLPIIYFILGKYFVAVCLTIVTSDAITAVAWDSAGVTTGPVTVPFVLSIGIGFSQAVNSPEGFGMLTIASVAPIISVLATSLMRKPAKAARRSLSVGARSLNRSFNNTFRMKRRMHTSPSFAMAAFAENAGASAGPTPDPSVHNPRGFNSEITAAGPNV